MTEVNLTDPTLLESLEVQGSRPAPVPILITDWRMITAVADVSDAHGPRDISALMGREYGYHEGQLALVFPDETGLRLLTVLEAEKAGETVAALIADLTARATASGHDGWVVAMDRHTGCWATHLRDEDRTPREIAEIPTRHRPGLDADTAPRRSRPLPPITDDLDRWTALRPFLDAMVTTTGCKLLLGPELVLGDLRGRSPRETRRLQLVQRQDVAPVGPQPEALAEAVALAGRWTAVAVDSLAGPGPRVLGYVPVEYGEQTPLEFARRITHTNPNVLALLSETGRWHPVRHGQDGGNLDREIHDILAARDAASRDE